MTPSASEFAVDDWARLRRFLRLGCESGVYYAKARPPTAQSTPATARCIAADGERVVREIVAASHTERTDPAIFALALAAASPDETTRRAALGVLPIVCQTGAQLFRFASFVGQKRGWGRGLRAAVAHWYNEKPVKTLAYQVVRYPHGDGFKHRDLLRLCHPDADTYGRQTLYHWITNGWERIGDAPHDQPDLQIIWAAEKARVPGTTAKTVAELIRVYGLPREAVPSGLMSEKAVWEALLERMTLDDLLHHLPTLTRVGVLDGRGWCATVAARLTDADALAGARIHPVALFAAQTRYALGRDERGKHRWTPQRKILDALDESLTELLTTVTPTGKRIALVVNPSAAMATARIAELPGMSPRRLADVMRQVVTATEAEVQMLPFGTDFSMVTAEAFLVFTDAQPPESATVTANALRDYREKTGTPARLAVVSAAAKGDTIPATPDDAGILSVLGFDVHAPKVIADFVRGDI